MQIKEINQLKKEIENVLSNNKALEIKSINLKDKTSIADFMIIASGNSSRHIQALSELLLGELKKKSGFKYTGSMVHSATCPEGFLIEQKLIGEEFSLFSIFPFCGILLSIAIFPLIAPIFWHNNYGKISAFWSLMFIFPFTIWKGFSISIHQLFHVALLEYLEGFISENRKQHQPTSYRKGLVCHPP